MNIDAEIKKIELLIRQAEGIRNNIKAAAKRTDDILAACEKLGVSRVGIGARDETFKDSGGHPFGYDGSIFVDGRYNGRPTAWAVAYKSGHGAGCGNSGQYQMRGDFLNGIYEHRDGFWRKQQ